MGNGTAKLCSDYKHHKNDKISCQLTTDQFQGLSSPPKCIEDENTSLKSAISGGVAGSVAGPCDVVSSSKIEHE